MLNVQKLREGVERFAPKIKLRITSTQFIVIKLYSTRIPSRFVEISEDQRNLAKAPYEHGIVIVYGIKYFKSQCFSSIGYQTHFYNPEMFGAYWKWQVLGMGDDCGNTKKVV